MNISRGMLVLLVGVIGFGPGQASADHGHIYVKNCDATWSMQLCTYDWDDKVQQTRYDRVEIGPGKTGSGECVKDLFGGAASGCVVELSILVNSCADSIGARRFHTGQYTVWGIDDGLVVRPGYADDCKNGNPTKFTLTGDEIEGCTPTITLYGDVEGKGDSYTLENVALSNMAYRPGVWDGKAGSLNDWVRAIKDVAGRWEICVDADYKTKCLDFWHEGGTQTALMRLDTHWNGNWDRKISSIRPKACE